MARLLADEDFPRATVLRLRALGHDVVTVLEAGLANLGTADDLLLAYAGEQGRAFITHNRLHFLRLHRRTASHAGIVVCTRDPDYDALGDRVDEALQGEDDLHGVLVRVNRGDWSRSGPQ